jgi:hypothetical protein
MLLFKYIVRQLQVPMVEKLGEVAVVIKTI